MSVRAEKALNRLGVQRLGDLDGVAFSKLMALRNCRKETVRHIQTLVQRANGGEFAVTPEFLQNATPFDLAVQIDQWLHRLAKRDREIITLRLGGRRHPPARLEAIGVQFHLSRERVNQIVHGTLRQFIRAGGPKTKVLLNAVVDSCNDNVCPLTPGLLLNGAPKPWPLPYKPEFYVRAIAVMRPDVRLPAATTAKRAGPKSAAVTAKAAKKANRRTSPAVRR
jgi:hypothetical protein